MYNCCALSRLNNCCAETDETMLKQSLHAANVEPLPVAEPVPDTYLIGVARADVTGPIVQVNMASVCG